MSRDMLSILIIESDGLLHRQLTFELDAQPTLISCDDLDLGLQLVRTRAFDLILIDSQDSLESRVRACDAIRSSLPNADTPILVSGTSRDDKDVAAALDTGADDYVTSSVGRQELMARIRSLLRRYRRRPRVPDNDLTLLSCRGITMDLAARRVHVDATEVRLTVKEFDTLATLLRASGSVVTRETLLVEAWNDAHYTNPRKVDAVLKRLRRKLIVAPHHQDPITTVRGFGYRIIET